MVNQAGSWSEYPAILSGETKFLTTDQGVAELIL